ncbi:MAG: prepilin-type N-terminal cleavage/methylation domain-containing protein [Gammaproteobacteria bacterium]|nr:prepilin-type N-terminal cleavage/methylation domain-containing protein [Gammaproteobacteria bacterium]
MDNFKSGQGGMTLIELAIVVVIVSILSTMAYSNYTQYTERARRMDAKSALMRIATNQERFYISNHIYTANLADLGFTGAQSENGYYDITVPAADNNTWQAVATPAAGSPQANDEDCQQFVIDAQNNVTATPDPDGKCW